MGRALCGSKGVEVRGAVAAQADGEEDAQAETHEGAHGRVGGDLPGGGFEGGAVGGLQTVIFVRKERKSVRSGGRLRRNSGSWDRERERDSVGERL